MLEILTTTQFKKDLKRVKKRGYDISKIKEVLHILAAEKVLDTKYKDHALVGNYIGFRECHIEPDWLLVYTISKESLVLVASRTGSHADLF